MRSSFEARRDGLDQIRGLAILYVIAVHTFDFWFPGGGSGVGVFFALSGYLTARRLIQEPFITWRVAGAFLIRRVFRIYPSFLVVMALIGFVINFWARPLFSEFLYALPGILVFWRPAFWEPFGIGVSIIWTLFVEFQYYILIPIFMLMLGKKCGINMICILLLVSSPILCLLGVTSTRGEGVFYYGSAMAFGSLLAHAEEWNPELFDREGWMFAWPLGLLVLILLLFIPQMNPLLWWIELNIAAIATCAMIGGMIRSAKWPVLPGLPAIGRLAYCLYLVHGPVIDWMRPILGLSMWGKILLFIPITFGFSIFLHRFIERPFIQKGNVVAARLSFCRRHEG